MKTRFNLRLSTLGLLILCLSCFNAAFSQVGITWGQPIEQVKVNSGIGFDTGVPGGSALQQLENMAGVKVDLSKSNSNYQSGQLLKSVVPPLSFDQQIKGMVVTTIFSSLLEGLFSSNNNTNAQNQLEAQKAAELAQKQAEEAKRKADSIAQVNYDKMMQNYKTLGDSNSLQIKPISDTNMSLKTLDDPSNNTNNQTYTNFFGSNSSAPLTQDEMEWQNIKNQGISTTWDPNAWSTPTPSNQILDEPPTPEESQADKFLTEAINKIETMLGGRVAAVAGRFMVNIKNGTLDYLTDATNAITSGNMAKMDELGYMDMTQKIVTNAIYNTSIQTAKAYYEQVKDFATDQIKEKNFEILREGGLTLLDKYKIYGHTSDEWKVQLKKY